MWQEVITDVRDVACFDGIDCGRCECGGCVSAADDIVSAVVSAGGLGGTGPTDAEGEAVISIEPAFRA